MSLYSDFSSYRMAFLTLKTIVFKKKKTLLYFAFLFFLMTICYLVALIIGKYDIITLLASRQDASVQLIRYGSLASTPIFLQKMSLNFPFLSYMRFFCRRKTYCE